MPELPEVETVRRGLQPYIQGRSIERLTVRDARLRWPVPADLARKLRARRIESIDRRGKYLIVALDNGDRLLLHLGMSGRLFIFPDAAPAPLKHDHVDIHLSGGVLLRFHDPRRFGAVLRWPAELPQHPLLASLGPEPLTPDFDAHHLHRCARGRRSPVKTLIMDGNVVVGVGNIYASEALFRAGLRPTRPAGRVSLAACERLVAAIREVLERAIDCGGTTLRDFAGAHGEAGYFQQDLMVYDREGQPCRHCGTPIRRCIIGQRSSYFCPRCQA